jgi:hypothetical protein
LNRDQLKTILWLRWRLTRNQWQRAGGFGAVLAASRHAIGIALIGLSRLAVGVSPWAKGNHGRQALARVDRGLSPVLADTCSTNQRSESIDLQRRCTCRWPWSDFFINYAASHRVASRWWCRPCRALDRPGLVARRHDAAHDSPRGAWCS